MIRNKPIVQFKRLDPRAVIPSYANHGDAGMDLHCLEAFSIGGGGRLLVPCGLAMAIPNGYEAQCRSRSGNALKKGVVVLNSPGTIDSGYRGEMKVILFNTNKYTQEFAAGDRIAQLVVSPVCRARVELVNELPSSERGAGGFGSTGA